LSQHASWAFGCGKANNPAPSQAAPSARNLVIITIDTLRADHVGAYGNKDAHTPALESSGHGGVLFTHAYATAPITLTSHASLMTGRYPPGHGARHNGLRIDLKTPTLADNVRRSGFATAAFRRRRIHSTGDSDDQGLPDLRRSPAAGSQWPCDSTSGPAVRSSTKHSNGLFRIATDDSSCGFICSSLTRHTVICPDTRGLSARQRYDEESRKRIHRAAA
jgi:hypothetical protein